MDLSKNEAELHKKLVQAIRLAFVTGQIDFDSGSISSNQDDRTNTSEQSTNGISAEISENHDDVSGDMVQHVASDELPPPIQPESLKIVEAKEPQVRTQNFYAPRKFTEKITSFSGEASCYDCD